MPGKKGKSGGPRTGAGRPAYFKVTQGDYLILERETIGGEIRNPELVKVLSVANRELELQTNDDIIVLRFPELDELVVK